VRPVVDGELEFPETLDKDRLTLALHPEGASGPVRVGADGDIREPCSGDRYMFGLSPG
jgi:hypothetical protein